MNSRNSGRADRAALELGWRLGADQKGVLELDELDEAPSGDIPST
jgi:hypothetical protein